VAPTLQRLRQEANKVGPETNSDPFKY
jgi:hypothetical protein